MARQLRIVIPPARPGLFRRVYAALATTRFAKRLSRLVNWKLDPVLLRVTGGRVATTLVFRSAVLETRGARTGKARRNAIIYFHDHDRVIITASNAGALRNPSWYHNLRVHPDVVFGGHRMRAEVVGEPAERARLQDLGDRTFPGFASYRAQAAAAGRDVPIVQLTPLG